jgi:hypothetical protein
MIPRLNMKVVKVCLAICADIDPVNIEEEERVFELGSFAKEK